MLSESDLHEYQRIAIDHVVNTKKCALFAFMGAGKTASVLTAIDRLLLSGEVIEPVLVIAPLRVARDVWPNEPAEWAHLKHLRVVPIVGNPVERANALHERAPIYSVNFENLTWLINLWGVHWPYRTIVVDESTKLKSLRASIRRNDKGTEWVQGDGGSRAKALLKKVYDSAPGRFIELSGTPAPNGLQDLWGQVYFLDYGRRLGRVFDAFQQRWFQRSFDGYGSDPLPHAQEQIQAAIADVCLSLKSEDWFPVEKPIVRNIYIDLPETARRHYQEMEKELYTEITHTPIEAFNAGARTQKLLQMASGFVYKGQASDPGKREWMNVHEEKLNALEEIYEEAAGEPLLVGYQFKSDLERILGDSRFKKAVHFSQAKGILERWNKGSIPMLLAHAGSVGHGLSLQHGGSRLVRYSTNWNHEEFSQLLERIGPVRQKQSGYHRNVYEYRILARRTIDEDVYECHETKGSVQDILMAGLSRRLRK